MEPLLTTTGSGIGARVVVGVLHDGCRRDGAAGQQDCGQQGDDGVLHGELRCIRRRWHDDYEN